MVRQDRWPSKVGLSIVYEPAKAVKTGQAESLSFYVLVLEFQITKFLFMQ